MCGRSASTVRREGGPNSIGPPYPDQGAPGVCAPAVGGIIFGMATDKSSNPPSSGPHAVVVMGVCGAGKTEIGRRLADALGWTFRDADDFHPAANVAKMRSGVPLTDDDRWPWLDTLAGALRDALAGRGDVVLACSALARRYRDRLGLPDPLIRLVHLDDPSGVIRKRIEQRAGHFMPATLLDSQLALLERPAADERPIVVDVAADPDAIVRSILTRW